MKTLTFNQLTNPSTANRDWNETTSRVLRDNPRPWPYLFRTLLVLFSLLTLSIGQMWGADVQQNAIIYMDNSAAGWDYSNIYFVINSTNGYPMTAVANTKLYVHKRSAGTWGGYSNVRFFAATSSWGGDDASMGGESNMVSYGANLTNTQTNYGFNGNNYYVIKLDKAGTKTSSSTRANLTTSYIGNAYTSMNKTITYGAKVSTDGGSSHSASTAHGALSASSKTFSSYNTCGTSSSSSLADGNASTTTTVSCGYTATSTLTAADKTNYTFEGWYNSSGTQQTTNKTLTIYPTAAATYYAYYKLNQYTVSYGVNSSTRWGSIKLNSGSAVTTTSSSTLNHGTAIAFTASPNSGYQVEGWYSDASCTAANRLQSGGTSYDAGTLTAAKTVYVKFEARTGGIVTLNAGSNGEVSLDNSSWGSSKTKSNITTNTAFNIYARGNTGYQFSSWTKNSGSGTIGSTSTANTTFTPVAYEDATLTASFAETKSTITVTTATSSQGTLKFGSTAKSWGTTASVGVATTQNITATAAAGFTFVRWDLSGAAASSSTLTNNTITLKADGTGSTGTATAVFAEDLTSRWHLVGNSSDFPDGWNVNNTTMMQKKTGHSTESVVYFTVNVTSTATKEFKIVDDNGSGSDIWYGYSNGSTYLTWTTTATNNVYAKDDGGTDHNANNLKYTPTVTGSYEFKVDYSGTYPAVTITYPTSYTLTYDIGTVKGNNGSISTSPSTSSGSKVISGTTITLTAPAAKTGYTWKGWYTNAAGTTGKIEDTNRAITVTMNADKTLYACYTENAFNVKATATTGGTVTPTSNTSMGQVTGGNITATPSAGYSFTNWTISSGSGYFGTSGTSTTSTTANTKFRPTAATTLLGTFSEVLRTVSVNVNNEYLGSVSATSLTNVGPETKSAAVTATPVTGATFTGWTLPSGVTAAAGYNSSSNPIKINATAASKTITANFSETMYSVTLNNDNSSYGTVNTSSPVSVGRITAVQIQATAKTNYMFSGWVQTGGSGTVTYYTGAGNGQLVDETGASKAITYICVTGNVTLKATWEEDRSSGYVVHYGNSGKNADGGADASQARPWLDGVLNKPSIAESNTSSFVFTASTEDVDKVIYFKIKKLSPETWYGNTGKITGTISNWTFSTGTDDARLCITMPGNYTFTWDKSTNKLSVTYPSVYYLRGGFNSWHWSHPMTETSSGVYSATVNITEANHTYSGDNGFKLLIAGQYYGKNSTTITRESNTAASCSTSGANIGITTDFTGNYTFSYNTSTNTLTVTYPTAYKITYGVGTINGSDAAVSVSPSFTSGAYVLPETDVTFSKGSTKSGYTWKGWYSKNDGTGTLHSSTDGNFTWSATRTGNVSVYACYTLNNYTITYNLNGGSNPVSPAPATSYTVESSAITLPTPTRTGYTFNGWYDNSSFTGSAKTTIAAGSTGNKAYWAKWTPNDYDIILDVNGGSGENQTVTATYDAAMPTTLKGGSDPIAVRTRAGYNFDGYSQNNDGSGTLYYTSALASNHICDIATNNTHIYAKWVAKQCTITLDFQTEAAGYASSGDVTNRNSLTATYGSAMTALTGTMPSAGTGYKFSGFYSAPNGGGTQYYTGTGASAHNWAINTEDGVTLYAFYEPATITSVTLNHEAFEYLSAASGDDDKDYVIITEEPTIEPTGYVTPINITWELQYTNGDVVDGHPVTYLGTNRAEFSIVGLVRGSYKLHATVRTGSTRGSGTIVSTYDKIFQIASDYEITVYYKCGDVIIKPSITAPGKPLDWTSITAPTIIGYAFSKWKAGDGVEIQGADANGEKASATVNYKATFDGFITAIYTKKNIIYFNNTLGWNDVWVYFYNNDKYWAANYGTGAYKGKYFDGTKPYWEMEHGHMTQIEGTNIWYFDYTEVGYSTRTTVAFANMDKSYSGTDDTSDNDKAYFSNTTASPIKVIRRSDHKAVLPMFVPLPGQTGTLKNSNKAQYYNEGYWMNYPENTGYSLKIWDGSAEVYNIPFEFTPEKTMPMSIDVNLDAAHTYEFKIYRIDDNWYGNNGTMKNGSSGDVNQTVWEFETGKNNCKIVTTAAGSYTFTLNYGKKSSNYYYLTGVHYPAVVNDFQILYQDTTTWSLSKHGSSWYHSSRMITARAGGVDTISFFVAKGKRPLLKARRIGSIAANTGVISWSTLTIGGASQQDLTVDSSAVYNFKVTQGNAGVISSIENIGAYTGNYYIRCGALANRWGNYRDDYDHLMTYTEFSESAANAFGPKYSHYKAKWCPRGTNIKFCIANDYSPCVTDTLTEDVPNTFNNINSDGTLKTDNSADPTSDIYSANVRFMWNRKTNKISRAYVSSATTAARRFLVLQGSGETNKNIFSSRGNDLTADPPGANSIILTDDQNWIYETTIQANPSALIKLFARYNGVDQYFRGTNAATFVKDVSAIEILGGEASSTKYSVRVIYDFKTNRLVCAWIPSGSTGQDISTNVITNADVMVVREHQKAAQSITFTNDESKLSQVKTVYGAMRFNRWILGNRANPYDTDIEFCFNDDSISKYHPPLATGEQLSQYERALYFISFPFDVRVSEIFGFGQYGQHYVLEYYDGLKRATEGYWIDSDPNWKYITPSMANTYVLEKNKGYILCLNLGRMAYNNYDFWTNNISEVELYFPSTSTIGEITAKDVTIPALGEEYRCTINRGTPEGDRRVKDSFWRCIGVPGYATYNGSLVSEGNTITWQTGYTYQEDDGAFPFLYAWNVTDNSLTAQSTTNYVFKAMHAYLVQNGNEITWTKANFRNNIVARRATKADIANTEWRLTLNRNGEMEDQAFIRMSTNDDVTDDFDFGQDLIKELNLGRSDIYSFIGYERVAANSIPYKQDETTIIPLGLNIETTDEYTFALPDGGNNVSITLVDSETGERTDLSAGFTYAVTLESGDYDNRFYLEIAPVYHIPTGVEPVNGEGLNGDKAYKVLINDILYIVRDGKMFDARGVMVK